MPNKLEFNGQQQQQANAAINTKLNKLRTVVLVLRPTSPRVQAYQFKSRASAQKFINQQTTLAKAYTLGDNLPKNIIADFCRIVNKINKY